MPNPHTITTTPSTADRESAAQVRVDVALASVEQAQRLLGQASEALSSVEGLTAQWRRLGALYDQVKRTWYAIDGKAAGLRFQGRLTLDREPGTHEERWRRLLEERRA